MSTIERSNMNYYNEIKNKIIDNEVYSKVKDYSKERHKVITYFEIGELLTEAGGKYGDKIIDEYSKMLVMEIGKKYNLADGEIQSIIAQVEESTKTIFAEAISHISPNIEKT